MALPVLTPEQRQQALAKAAEARKKRAELKGELKSGQKSLRDVLSRSGEDTVGKRKVSNVIESLLGVGEGGLLEWGEVFGNRYGPRSEFVEERRRSGRDVILEIDVQGARQVRDRVPEALLILLEPPSLDELARRLRGRGTESEEKIARRLAEAARELDQRELFDHVVVNDDLQAASSQVAAIIEASRSDSEDVQP